MTMCDNGGNVTDELPPDTVSEAPCPKRLRKKGVLTRALATKLKKRAVREKPNPPYKLAMQTQECPHPQCSFIRKEVSDPRSLCVLHAWKRRYRIEE